MVVEAASLGTHELPDEGQMHQQRNIWPVVDIEPFIGLKCIPADQSIDMHTAVRLKREQIQLVVDGDVVGTGVAARKGLLQGHLLEKSD